jgi:RimJ/RimL family protein N-acetyltransferase
MPDAAALPDCKLRPWVEADDARTVQWLNDPAIRATFGITSQVTLEGHRAWKAANTQVVAWAIESGGLHCGNLLLDVNRRHRSAYLQIYIGAAAAQGRGLGQRAMSLALDEAFGPMALHRVWLHTRADNARAIALYRKLGFRAEGTERQSVLLPSGGWADQTRWSLLSDEWRRP